MRCDDKSTGIIAFATSTVNRVSAKTCLSGHENKTEQNRQESQQKLFGRNIEE